MKPTVKNRQALEAHCRTATHVAHLTGFTIEELTEEAARIRESEGVPTRRQRQRSLRELPDDARPASERLVQASETIWMEDVANLEESAERIGDLLKAAVTAAKGGGVTVEVSGKILPEAMERFCGLLAVACASLETLNMARKVVETRRSLLTGEGK